MDLLELLLLVQDSVPLLLLLVPDLLVLLDQLLPLNNDIVFLLGNLLYDLLLGLELSLLQFLPLRLQFLVYRLHVFHHQFVRLYLVLESFDGCLPAQLYLYLLLLLLLYLF